MRWDEINVKKIIKISHGPSIFISIFIFSYVICHINYLKKKKNSYFLFIIIINQKEKRTQNEKFGHYHSEINTYYKTGLKHGL